MKATEVTAGLAESNGSLLPGIRRDSLHVTCGLTACTQGSAPAPTLGNECGKTSPLTSHSPPLPSVTITQLDVCNQTHAQTNRQVENVTPTGAGASILGGNGARCVAETSAGESGNRLKFCTV